MSSLPLCILEGCSKQGKFTCTACRSATFCSVECQKLAWPLHKNDCRAKSKLETAGAAKEPVRMVNYASWNPDLDDTNLVVVDFIQTKVAEGKLDGEGNVVNLYGLHPSNSRINARLTNSMCVICTRDADSDEEHGVVYLSLPTMQLVPRTGASQQPFLALEFSVPSSMQNSLPVQPPIDLIDANVPGFRILCYRAPQDRVFLPEKQPSILTNGLIAPKGGFRLSLIYCRAIFAAFTLEDDSRVDVVEVLLELCKKNHFRLPAELYEEVNKVFESTRSSQNATHTKPTFQPFNSHTKLISVSQSTDQDPNTLVLEASSAIYAGLLTPPGAVASAGAAAPTSTNNTASARARASDEPPA